MDQIRNSRQGMLAKNQMFQKVLNEYSALANPTVTSSVPGSVLHEPTSIVVAGETEAGNS
jgi:hypothetical protein